MTIPGRCWEFLPSTVRSGGFSSHPTNKYQKHIMMLSLAHLWAMMDMLIVLVLNLYNDPQNPGFHQAGREPMYDSRYGGFLNGNLKQEHLFSPSETTRLSKIVFLVYTRLPQTKIAPENGWLEDEFPFGMVETCVYDYDSD